jgi:2-polyprenyl-3-methyl-5-hydroxy-6-metoxy-1,4-benzoquinol methylase
MVDVERSLRERIRYSRTMSRLSPVDPLELSSLSEHRMRAALASQAMSGEAIHHAVLRAARTLELTGDILDFGAGTGVLLGRFRASGFTGTMTGADLLPRPAAIRDDVKWIETDLNEPLPLPAGAFDGIVSTEVIEHLENPRAVFRELHRLLRPRGKLLVTTPNQESLRALAALVVRGHFVDFLDGSYPAHITALVRKDFERIAAESGFDRPRFIYTNEGGLPRLPTVKWQTVSFGLLRGRLFSDNLLVLTRRDAAPC